MLLNPNEAVERGLVQNLYDVDEQVQPNAIDFTVDRIDHFVTDVAAIGKSSKKMRVQSVLNPIDGVWTLEKGQEYDVSSKMYVEVPEGYAAMLILRSTFVRNGAWLASGLYDSGFKGNIGAVLHIGNATLEVEEGTRLGQIMFIKSDSAGVYAGGYNSEKGVHWTEGSKNGKA